MSTSMEDEESVILVFGDEKERESKALVADMLAEGRGASQMKTTRCGARVFSRVSAPGHPVVVDTTVMLAYVDSYVQSSSAVWSSLNSLRQMQGKVIYVVCVVASSGPDDPLHRKHEFWDNESTWLNVLAFTFDQHRQDIMVLAKLEGTDQTVIKKSAITDALTRCGFAKDNVDFVTFTKRDLQLTIKSALEGSSVYLDNAEGRRGERWGTHKTTSTSPFRVRKVSGAAQHKDWHGPWGPTPVILFGTTGSGKSTIAQMLTKGRLNPYSKDFVVSSSIRGETKQLTEGEGRGWYVVDTPSFGEPENEEAGVSTGEAERKLTRYVKLIQGRYGHFLYVVMKDRMDQLEEQLWGFFVPLFGENISYYFTVVISDADDRWVEQNKAHLQSVYKGCKSFLGAEFPATNTDDPEWEAELELVRRESLCNLEEELANTLRVCVTCDFGLYSKATVAQVEAEVDMCNVHNSVNNLTNKALVFGFSRVFRSYAGIRRLMMMLERDGKFLLLPK